MEARISSIEGSCCCALASDIASTVVIKAA
jgi:hypothetical protein